MTRLAPRSVLVAASVVVAGFLAVWGVSRLAGWAGSGRAQQDGGALARRAHEPPAAQSEAARRDAEIAFHEERVAARPDAWLDLARLAGLYLRRSRETGDHRDIHRAEEAARRSLSLSTNRNSKAFSALLASLMGQHRFAEARDAAAALREIDPDEPMYLSQLAEIWMELGEYDSARVAFEALAPAASHPTVAARLARWYELTGRDDEGLRLLRASRGAVVAEHGVLPEHVAWFHLRIGDLLARTGRLDEAEQSFHDGLRARPSDHRLLAALARAAAAHGAWREAIDWGEKSLAIAREPAVLVLVGDAWAALGDSSRAAGSFAWAERLWVEHDEAFPRAWHAFALDHDVRLEETLAALEEEIAGRRDVYGYDLLAWALHKSGDHARADSAMALALRLGTREALFHYHAGLIARAAGDAARAQRHLRSALDTNPRFHPRFATVARALLDTLRAAEGGASLPE